MPTPKFLTSPRPLLFATGIALTSLIGSLLVVAPSTAAEADLTAPAAVRSLKVTADRSRVKLDWSSNREPDLAGYLVYRATTVDGPYLKLTATPRSGSDYSDTAARVGLPSYYRVTAVDKAGNESAVVPAVGTRRDSTAPLAPKTASVTPAGGFYTVDWADNTEADIAGYMISRATSSGGSYTKLTTTPVTDSEFSDTKVPSGRTPFYKITAVDYSGNTSPATSVTVPDTAAPAAVRGIVAKADASKVTLNWSSNSERDLAGYLVFRAATAEGPFTKLTATPRTSSDYSDTTATPGTPSYYRVFAVDKSGNESAPVSITATRRDGVAPAAPRSFTAVSGSDGVALNWTDGTENDLAGYVVSRATSSGGTYVRLTTDAISVSEFLDTTAPAGATSYYRVTAIDLSGNTSSAASAAAAVPDTVAPAAVRGIVTSSDTSRVKLDWTSNTERDLAGYLVYRATAAEGPFTKLTATPRTGSDYSDTTVVPGIPAFYQVVAIDESGNESAPVSVSATRKDGTAPVAPRSLAAVPGTNGVALDWADNTEADLAGYIVSRASSPSGSYTRLTETPVAASEFLHTTAPEGVTSYYRVSAVDVSGNVSSSASANAAVADVTAPVAPEGLAATGTRDGIKLEWAKNPEPDIAGYLVYSSESADGTFTKLTGTPVTALTYLDAAASATAPTFYRLIAVDTAGNASAPATAEGIPADTVAPVTPADISAVGSDTGVALEWADNTEADLGGYLVYRATQADGIFSQLSAQPISVSNFTDESAPAGVVAYYRVVAVDLTGNSSQAATTQATRTLPHTPIAGADLTVASDGTGDYTTVGAALAAAPVNATTPFIIGIKPGSYFEVITVSKPNVHLVGATPNAADVLLFFNNASGTPKPDGSGTYGTTGSASMLIKSNDVTVKNLTIMNSYQETGSGSEQAVALKTTGDRLVFDNVRLIGDQDTLYVDSPAKGQVARAYFVNSYIEGDVDFVFGRGTAVFDRSELKAATRGSATNNGYVTAASTDKSTTYGYLITDSTITSDAPAQSFSLGRPWQPSGDVNAIAQVVIRNTSLPAAIKGSPWTDMSATFSWRNARFFEYQNTGAGSGTGADRPQLTDAEAENYTKFTYLAGTDNWNPTGQTPPPPPADTIAPAAPADLTATAGDAKVSLSWPANADADLAGYNLYRADAQADAEFVRVNTATLTGARYTDTGLTNGATYRYRLTAVDKAENESSVSVTVEASPAGIPIPANDALVATDGTGHYATIQAALAAANGSAADPFVIAVKPGTYKEMVTVGKNHVRIVGTTGDARDVVLTYDNAAGTTIPGGTATYGTGRSQSVLVSGNNVTVQDLTIENSFDEAAVVLAGGEQAVALKTTGDRLVFDNVRLLGNQDTLLVDSPDAPVIARSYFVDSYIEGDVDFIFGRGTAVFDRSTIHALSRGSSSNNGYLTAASTSDHNPHGFLIIDSTVTSNAPAGTFSLGRPWRGWGDGYAKNGAVYNSRGQVTIRNTALPAAIRTAQPWADMVPNLWTDGRFSEYGNTGPGATVNANRPQLTDEGAAGATKATYLAGSDGWNPSATPAPAPESPVAAAPAPDAPAAAAPQAAETVAPAAPADVRTALGKSTVSVSWTASTEQGVVGYNVYRATGGGAAEKVSGSTPVPGGKFTDTTPVVGTAYTYTVTAVNGAALESAPSAGRSATPVKADVIVAADGSGDAATVQAGIDLLANNADFTTQGGRIVLIQPGTYTGLVTSGNRYGVTLLGASANPEDTVLTAGDTGSVATLTIAGKGWSVKNLTVRNTNGPSATATATAMDVKSGDRQVFENVRFIGDKTTLLLSTANTTTYTRMYFRNVYVEGGADMILGRAVAVFQSSTFRLLNRPGGVLTDSSIAGAHPYGFLITDSEILTDGAAGSMHLGRPYGTNGKAQVVVRNTEIGAGISTTRPWKDWDAATTWTAGRFSEYQNTGAGAAVVDPAMRPQLTDADAAGFTAASYLAGSDGWNPTQ